MLHALLPTGQLPGFEKNILIVALIITIVLPLAFMPVLVAINLVKDPRLNDTRERVAPFTMIGAIYFAGYILFHTKETFAIFGAFMLILSLLIIISAAISRFWKISMHMLGIGGLCGLLLALGFGYGADITAWLIGTVLVGGMVAFARLRLKVHSPAQIFAGFMLSFFSVYIFLMSVPL